MSSHMPSGSLHSPPLPPQWSSFMLLVNHTPAASWTLISSFSPLGLSPAVCPAWDPLKAKHCFKMSDFCGMFPLSGIWRRQPRRGRPFGAPRLCFLSALCGEGRPMGGRTSRYAQKRWDHAQPGQSWSGSSRGPRLTGALGHSLHYPISPRPLLTCHPLTEASAQYPFKTRTGILVPLHCSMWPF